MEMMIYLALSCLILGASSSSNFLVTPLPMTVTNGSVSKFNCSAEVDIVFFLVNGTSVNLLENPDIEVTTVPGIEPRFHTLQIVANEEYNNTQVECVAFSRLTGTTFSNGTVLIIQGLLPSVNTLMAISKPSSILLTWIPPFSLDITGVDPDLWYCIEIYNSSVNTTSETTKLLSANCSVYLPEFTFVLNPPNPCDEFQFKVTPVNGAGNGSTSKPVNGYFLAEPEIAHQVDVVVAVRELVFMVNVSFTLDICVGNDATFFKVYADERQLQLHNIDLKYVDWQLMVVITVTFSDQYLNQIYHILVEAGNTVGSSNSTDRTLLSTNDVQAVSAGSHLPGTVNISCTFATNTQARGFLAVIVQTQSALSVIFSVALRDDSSSEVDMLVQGLAAGTYNAVVFDIEKNGIPETPNTLAAGAENVSVSSGTQRGPTTSGSAAVRVARNGSVCVTCTFATFSDAMGCVALFLPDNNMMKLLVRIITKHPNESSVDMCLNETHGVYVVAVFERQSDGVISSNPANVSQITITVIPQPTSTPLRIPPLVPNFPAENNTLVILTPLVLCVLVIIAVVLGSIIFVVFKMKREMKANTDSEEPYYTTVYTGQSDVIEMKENDAYGRPLPKREIMVEENTAYGVPIYLGSTSHSP